MPIPTPAAADMPDPASLDRRLVADLRSDHAGETGAVWIYRGLLALAMDPEIRRFARAHLDTEQRHLAFFEDWLPHPLQSRLLPLWRLSGWLLGALSLLGGRRGVYLTIEAVETFVVQHYQEQIDYLREARQHREIRAVLRRFQRDEELHREDAADRGAACGYAAGSDTADHDGVGETTLDSTLGPEGASRRPGWIASAWVRLVGEGSRLAVVAARKL